MENNLIRDIIRFFAEYRAQVLIVENNDGFLFRPDVIDALEQKKITVAIGNHLTQRVLYELREDDEILFLINKENRSYLEDIERNSFRVDFSISTFLFAYHIPTIINLELDKLDKLYTQKQVVKLTKKQTEKKVAELCTYKTESRMSFDQDRFDNSLKSKFATDKINWSEIARLFGEAIYETIGTDSFEFVLHNIELVNFKFQEFLEKNYDQIKNSNAVRSPQVVSKILDFIDFNFKKDKVALIVVDGMSFWQYILIAKNLPGRVKEDIIYSWIPSITQLSRQAIFRGETPQENYVQNPRNEEKLWRNYWLSKQINDFEIDYQHTSINLENLALIRRLGIVYKDLDDYIHSSKDYKDLIKLTENWIERSEIHKTVKTLLNQGFNVFISSDHGNIEAKGWRGLTGKEKLGTNKSGSRSERHIEYSEEWLKEEFVKSNPQILDSITQESRVIYFKNNLSFSKRDKLVSHGGTHFLEVAIPFISITNE